MQQAIGEDEDQQDNEDLTESISSELDNGEVESGYEAFSSELIA
jgi:hypothetical protein